MKGKTMQNIKLGLLTMCLIALPACSTTVIGNPVPVEVPVDRTILKTDKRLLDTRQMQVRPTVRTNEDLEEWAIITDDARIEATTHRDKLIGAEMQRQASQAEIDAATDELRKARLDAIEEIKAQKAKVRRKWLKGWF